MRLEEERIKNQIQAEVSSVCFTRETEDRILDRVHGQIGKRRMIMRLSKKKTGILFAAAMAVIGTVTAIGAGRIAHTSGGTNLNEGIYSVSQLTTQGKDKLGQGLKIAESFSDGSAFQVGYVSEVKAWDENGNQVGTYPEVQVVYSGDKKLSLSVSEPIGGNWYPASESYDRTENYEGIVLNGKAENYLFLPPDAEPSEADKRLEQAGKLMISYGSDQEERQCFTSISWTENGLQYLLHTFENVDISQMMEFAKEVIDSGK